MGNAKLKKQKLKVRKFLNLELKFFILLFSFLTFLPVYAQNIDKKQDGRAFQFAKNQQIQQIRPKKPVKIKLHRNANGEYTWDLTGDSVDDVVQSDRRLRKLLKVE